MAGDQTTSDPRGHLATCGTCTGFFPGSGPEGRTLGPRAEAVFSSLGALLGAARHASPRTPLPWATALLLRLPLPAPSSAPPPPTSAPAKANPRTCQSPILASMDIASRRSWRRVPSGHGLEGSVGPAPWNRLSKSSFFYLLTNISPGHKELGCYLPTHARWPRNSLRQPQSQHLSELTWEVMDL